MKKLIVLILISTFIIGCGNANKSINNTYSSVNKMELLQKAEFTKIQIDSVIVADSLKVFNKWHINNLYNNEDNSKIEQRLFIKQCKNGDILNYSTTYSNATKGKYVFKKIKYSK